MVEKKMLQTGMNVDGIPLSGLSIQNIQKEA